MYMCIDYCSLFLRGIMYYIVITSQCLLSPTGIFARVAPGTQPMNKTREVSTEVDKLCRSINTRKNGYDLCCLYACMRIEKPPAGSCVSMSRPQFTLLISKFATQADVNHFIAKWRITALFSLPVDLIDFTIQPPSVITAFGGRPSTLAVKLFYSKTRACSYKENVFYVCMDIFM